MENEVLKLILSVEDKSVIKATQEAKRLEKEIKALVATEKVLGKEHEIVKQKTIEIKRKLQDYANISSQKAVPTLKKLIQTERTLSLEVDKNTAALTRNTKATKTAANATNQYGIYAAGAGKKLNTMNMRIQQGGYQLQDFFVQIQSGTSFFTAFAQQGSQFAGVFGPTGAVLGAVIAIGSAIAAMAYNSYNASKDMRDLSDVMDDLSDVSSDLLDSFTEIDEVLDSTADNMGLVSDAYKTFLDLKLQDNLLEQTRQFRSLGSSISDSAGELSTFQRFMLGLSKGPQGMGILAPLMDPFGTQRGISERFEKGLSGQNVQETLGVSSEVLGKRLSEYDRALLSGDFESAQRVLVDLYDDVFANVSKTNDVFNSTKTAIESTIDLLQKRLDIENDTSQVIKDAEEAKKQAAKDAKTYAAGEAAMLKILQKKLDAEKKIDDLIKSRVSKMHEQAALMISEGAYRKAGADETYIQNELEKKKLELYIKQEKLNDDQAASLRLALKALQDQEETLKRINIEEQARLSLQSLQVKAIEESPAGQALRKYGARGTRSDKDPTFGTGSREGKSIYDEPPKAPKDPVKQKIKDLSNQLDLETQLIGKFGKQRDLQNQLIQARQQYSDVATPAQMLEIENTIKAIDVMEQKQQALEDIKDKYEGIGKTIAGSMDQAFMSVVTDIDILKDSFEDMAFKVDRIFQDMARDIIAHLYQVLVVQQMVRGFGGMLSGFSNPILSAIGGGLESYDGGGYTGSGPRSGGLDGKGGYMAMLHPRETVVDHTKGQSTGGDTVTVNQTINVSTGIQQTVRAEIKQLMPQIADSAKSAVVDAKRRGGSYGRAFA